MAETDHIPGIKNWKTNFFPIWIGEYISLIGSELVSFALIWYLTAQTESAIVLSIASLVGLVPRIILSPFLGALVDRWNRKQIMIFADAGIAIATAVLAILFWLEIVQIWHIYLILALRSIGGSFHYPASVSSISLMVPKSKLVKIQGLSQLFDGAMLIFTAPLAAMLIEWIPISNIILIDVATALLAIIPLIFAVIPQPDRALTEEEKNQHPLQNMLADTRTGFQYILKWPALLQLSFMMILINFVIQPAFSLQPLLVKTHFNGSAIQLGYSQSAVGLGLIIGGLLLTVWGGFKRRIYSTMFGIFLIGLATISVGFLASNMLHFLIAAMFLVGVAVTFANGPSHALRQEIIEPEMQGRYFAMSSSLSSLMSPISLALAGPLAEWLGIQTWFIIGGIVCITMSLVGVLNPTIRNIANGPPRAVTDHQPAV